MLHHVPMTAHTESVDPLTSPRTLLAHAEALGNDAIEWRRAEKHDLAGRCREEQRALMKRAEVLALVQISECLDAIANELQRVSLSR